MRLPLALLLIFLVNMMISNIASAATSIRADKKTGENHINLDEPPFWMPSYDEFIDLSQEQKDFYMEKFTKQLRDVPLLQEVTSAELKEATEWAPGWRDLQIKLYRYCQDKKVESKCDDIADTRIHALEMGSLRGPAAQGK